MKSEEEKWLTFYSNTMHELVDIGVTISIDLMKNEDLNKINNFSGYMYLKNLLEILDSISINIANGITGTSTKTLNRVALEYFFGAYYLFIKKTHYQKKCKDIAFISILEERKGFEPFYKENLKKTSEKLKNQYKIDVGSKLSNIDYSKNQKKYDQLLNHSDFKEVKNEYTRTKNKDFFKYKNIVPWYSLWDGPNNIEILSRQTETWNIYDSLYRNFSLYLHGHKTIEINRIHKDSKGTLFTYAIGTPYELNFITSPFIYICHYLFHKILNDYIIEKDELMIRLDEVLLNYFKYNPKEDPFDPITNSFKPFPE
ncbi:DUF5677 domain-containing protein [Aquiflexum sp.]|uniref:DUF5677 domain-containing protein n=1 Tax=Aquiflexum sp. TaxID=1872584 RepID=UPI003594642E